jgi:hypothetical protein
LGSFYSRAVYAPTSYDERLGAFFDPIRIKHGFLPTAERTPASAPAARPHAQLSLGLG